MTLRGHNGPDGPEAVADTLVEVSVETLRDQFDNTAEADLMPGRLPLSRRKAEREIAMAMLKLTYRGMVGETKTEVLQANQTYAYKGAARVVAARAIKTFLRLRSLPYESHSNRAYAARLLAKRAANYLVPGPYRVRPDLGYLGTNDSPGITLDAI
jgi:hypothetical protein